MKKTISVLMSLVMILSITMGICTSVFADDDRRVYEGTTTCYNKETTGSYIYIPDWSTIYYTDYETLTYYFKAEEAGIYLIKLPENYDEGSMLTNNGVNYVYLKKNETYSFSYNQNIQELDYNRNCIEKYNVTISKITEPFEYEEMEGTCKYFIDPKTMTAELKKSNEKNVKETVLSCAIISVGQYAFERCYNYTEITLPKTVTYIDSYAFADCIRLQKVSGVSPLCKFGEQVFIGCPNSASVYDYHGNKIDISANIGIKDDSTTPISNNEKDNNDSLTSVTKPATISTISLSSKSKAISVSWKKVKNVNGYDIQVATDKKFKKNKKTVTVAKQNASKKTVKNLKKNKKYYVRVRSYKIANGKKVYGKWSNIKSIKTK